MMKVLPLCFAIASAWSKGLQITLIVAAISMTVPSEITLNLCDHDRYDPISNISECRWIEYKAQYPFAMLKQDSHLVPPECSDNMPAEIPLCDGQFAKVVHIFVIINIIATVYTFISLVVDLSRSENCCHIIKGAFSYLDLAVRGVLMLIWLASGIVYASYSGRIPQCIHWIKQRIRSPQDLYYWCETLTEDSRSASLILFAISFGLWAVQLKLALAHKAMRSIKTDSNQSHVTQVRFKNFDSKIDETVLYPWAIYKSHL